MTQSTFPASLSRAFSPAPARPELTSVLLGPSAVMSQLWMQLRRLAPHIRSLLLTGPADCGQEAVARLLLELSPQRHRSFLSLSAAEIDARLLRSGGLTSLPQDAFVFLPDLDRLSPDGQAALLHLMRLRRSRTFTVVAATAEPSLRSGAGQILPALAEVLGAVTVALPALQQRPEDLPMLFTHLLGVECARRGSTAPQLDESFLRAAMQHTWSGNLAELGRVVAALVAGSPREELVAADLLPCLEAPARRAMPATTSTATRLVSLDVIMQEHTEAVLRACRGNKQRAAEVLGISRSTLYRMLDASPANTTSLSLAS